MRVFINLPDGAPVPKVTFEEGSKENGFVALNSRMTRDPDGKPTSKTRSENYSKNVQTKYEPQGGLKKQTKKRIRNREHDSSSEEDPPADVSAVTASDIYRQVLKIAEQRSAGSKTEGPKVAEGTYKSEQNKWSNSDSNWDISHQHKHPGAREARSTENRRGRSPPQNNSQFNPSQNQENRGGPYYRERKQTNDPSFRSEQRTSGYGQTQKYAGSRSGKGGHHNFHRKPPAEACKDMLKGGICITGGCTSKHGKHMKEEKECHHIGDGTPCPHIWKEDGCKFSHQSKNA